MKLNFAHFNGLGFYVPASMFLGHKLIINTVSRHLFKVAWSDDIKISYISNLDIGAHTY